ncbi:MAG TPA: MFS transporter [Bryobacteraceae bacterium]|nr:MFS transporter [Bryobacteraceae bacterium]
MAVHARESQIESRTTVSPYRWVMISLAFFATAINYVDRQALSVAAPVLIDQFHMSNVAYSRVLFGFLLSYTIMNAVSGPVIDRLGTKAGYALCIAWWSVSSALHAFTTGALSLGVFRFLLGIGEAGNWPAALKVVAEWFPERERALASGLFNSGSAVGAILAPPLVAFMIFRVGWPAAFLLVGILGFIWLVFWLKIYRTPAEIQTEIRSSPPNAWRLFKTRFVWTFTLSKIFMDPVWYFYIFWFPEYLRRARHFDMAQIGEYAWIPFFIAAIGNILGGIVSSWLIRGGMRITTARKTAVTFFALWMTAAIPAVLVHSAWLSIAFVSIAMAGYTGSLANMLALPTDVFEKNAIASVYGLASMGAGFGGMLFSLITGWVVDHFSYTPVFVGFGLMPLVCALILWVVMGPIRSPILVPAS